MPIRDDTAGPWQTINPPDQSWLDFLGMKAHDVGSGARNALSNISGALSPVSTMRDGQDVGLHWQVPPMISGVYDAGKRLHENSTLPDGRLGIPNPGNEQNQTDVNSILMSMFGGNAFNPLKGSAAAVEAGTVISGVHPNYDILHGGAPVGRAYVREYPKTIQLGNIALEPEFQRQGIMTEAQKLLAEKYGKPTVPDHMLSDKEYGRWQKNDPAAVADYVPFGGHNYQPAFGSDAYYAAQGLGVVPGTRAASGELFSDTGKPSLMGSAVVGAEHPQTRFVHPHENTDAGIWAGMPSYQTFDNGKKIGHFYYDELPNAVNVREAYVDPEYRGQGITSRAFGQIQDDIGKPLTPDVSMTKDGYELWKNHYPEAVKNYTQGNDGMWRPAGAHGNISASYAALENGVPNWRMAGGPGRDENVLWSDTGKPSLMGSAAGQNRSQDLTTEDILKMYGL